MLRHRQTRTNTHTHTHTHTQVLLCVIFGACKVEQQDPVLSFKNIISVHRSAFDVPNDDSLYWHVRGPRCDQEVNVIEFYNSTFIPECKELLCSPMATVDGAAASAPGAADLPRKTPQSPTRKLLVCISPLHGTHPYMDACERTCMHVHKHSCICLHAFMHTYIIGAEQHFYLADVAGARVHKQHRDDAAHITPLYLRA